MVVHQHIDVKIASVFVMVSFFANISVFNPIAAVTARCYTFAFVGMECSVYWHAFQKQLVQFPYVGQRQYRQLHEALFAAIKGNPDKT
jgi:hypothetical protein